MTVNSLPLICHRNSYVSAYIESESFKIHSLCIAGPLGGTVHLSKFVGRFVPAGLGDFRPAVEAVSVFAKEQYVQLFSET